MSFGRDWTSVLALEAVLENGPFDWPLTGCLICGVLRVGTMDAAIAARSADLLLTRGTCPLRPCPKVTRPLFEVFTLDSVGRRGGVGEADVCPVFLTMVPSVK